jgi:ABC-2 type transport system permease protein
MTAFLSVLLKDIKVRFSSPLELVFFLVLPIVFTTVLAGTGRQPDPSAAAPLILVQDKAHDDASRMLAAALRRVPDLRIRQVTDPTELLRLSDADVLLTLDPAVPASTGLPFGVVVRLSPWRASAGQSAQLLRAYLTKARRGDLAASRGATAGSASAAASAPTSSAATPTFSSGDSVDPNAATGSAGQIVTWVLVPLLGLGSTFVAERRRGTLRRILSTPTRRLSQVAGTAGAEVLAAVVQVAVLVSFGAIAFHLPWLSHPLALAGLTVSFCAAGAALGALFGMLCRTERQAGSLSLALALVLAIFGGCWYPASLFPASLQSVTRLDPAGWAMDGFLAVLAPGALSANVAKDAVSLVLFAALVLLITAVLSRVRRPRLA